MDDLTARLAGLFRRYQIDFRRMAIRHCLKLSR
jgi:hypothetical protein